MVRKLMILLVPRQGGKHGYRSVCLCLLAILVHLAPAPAYVSGQRERAPEPQGAIQKAPRGIPKTAGEFSQRATEIRAYLRKFVEESVVPGVSVALGVGNEFTRFEGFGVSALDSGRPVIPQTRFRIGSVSKALTTAALGLLLEKGRLDLDADVRQYVPEYPDKGHPITVRQLAVHQAGIRHYRGDEALSNRSFASVVEAVSVFADDPLVVHPGTAFSYSTYGYTLLSAAMERSAGKPFLTIMREEVLEPLRMAHTNPEVAGRLLPDQATGYEQGESGTAQVAPKTDLSVKWAGGGYVSTAGDLLKFARALLNGRFLQQETRDLLWTAQATEDGTATPTGIGWQVTQMPSGRRLLVAGGSAIGGTTVLFVVPEVDVVLVFMSNLGNAPIKGVPMRALRMLLGDDDEPAELLLEHGPQ